MSWSSSVDTISEEETEILLEAKKRFKACQDWESEATWS